MEMDTKRVYEAAKRWLDLKKGGAPASELEDALRELDDTIYDMEDFFNSWVYDHLPVRATADSSPEEEEWEYEKWNQSFYKWYPEEGCGIDIFDPDNDNGDIGVDNVMKVFLDGNEVVVKDLYSSSKGIEYRAPISEVFEDDYAKALEEVVGYSSESNLIELDEDAPMPKLEKMIEETWKNILERIYDNDLYNVESALEDEDYEKIVKIAKPLVRRSRDDLIDYLELEPEQIARLDEAIIAYAEENNIRRGRVEYELLGNADEAYERYFEKKLFNAIYKGNVDGVRSALDAGADVNAKNEYGTTPLQSSRGKWSRGNAEVVRLLLDRGVDPKQDPDAVLNAAKSPEFWEDMSRNQKERIRDGLPPKNRKLFDKLAKENASRDLDRDR